MALLPVIIRPVIVEFEEIDKLNGVKMYVKAHYNPVGAYQVPGPMTTYCYNRRIEYYSDPLYKQEITEKSETEWTVVHRKVRAHGISNGVPRYFEVKQLIYV